MKWNQKGIVACLILFVLVLGMMLGSSVRNHNVSDGNTYASEEDMVSLEDMMSSTGGAVTGAAAEENRQAKASRSPQNKKKESINKKTASPSPSQTPQADGKKENRQTPAVQKKATKPPARTQSPKPSPAQTAAPTTKQTEPAVYLEIQCKRIMNQQSLWKEGIEEIIPKSGVFYSGSCSYHQGDTVYDILKRVCGEQELALDSSYTPLYGSYYIRGIGNLYEFDCGSESGWKYSVNGVMPGVGSSQYTVTDQDRIVFFYDYQY